MPPFQQCRHESDPPFSLMSRDDVKGENLPGLARHAPQTAGKLSPCRSLPDSYDR